MSDHIPFNIQTEIVKRLPVKPVIRFRSVSKQWKSLITSYEFINDHTRINRNRSHHHFLVSHQLLYRLGRQYTSIIDDDTFPDKKSSLTLPKPLRVYCGSKMLSSVNGLSCFYIFREEFKKSLVVLWNPIIRKSVSIVIPSGSNDFVIGFGFCSDASDPKLVKVNGFNKESKVMVFTLSSRVWKSVCNAPPALWSSCCSDWNQVCIKGCIYWWGKYSTSGKDNKTNVIVSFDLESEKFGQVLCLPECLSQTDFWKVAEVNESLGVLADYGDGFCNYGCGVWMMDFVTKSFTKMFTIEQPRGKGPFHGLNGVLGFRNIGEVIISVMENIYKSELEVYEPSSGRINRIGINGQRESHIVRLYRETLVLLDDRSSVIP